MTLPTQVRIGFGRKQEGLKRGTLPNLLATVLSIGLGLSHAPGQSPTETPKPATTPTDTPSVAPTPTPSAESQAAVAAAPAEPAPGDDTPPPAPTVSVSEHGTVTLAAQGIEITKLLELLSIKSRMNIVASEKVKAQIGRAHV